ncbi:MAG: hypothetical protein KGI68_06325 [Alphaproteobacteria bacterium]|nr:hypothetical protein [Alphaproteobacteria bacterium]MDE1986918.1 hypothetical protein [Alphaproteobacteria bacterium]MDE2265147.1 hypothetical protein [Alphaproteobacteria bacterium]
MRRFAILLFVTFAAAACSRHTPPVGRWVGNYESSEVMVDARLEILPNGQVRVSAPDLFDIGEVSDDDRAAMHARLASDLADSWDQVSPRPMDFDGRVFRKPGGVAPQMEWNPSSHEMKLVFYFGTMHSIHIAMHAVDDFRGDPWAD